MTWLQLTVALAWGTWVVLLAAVIVADALKKGIDRLVGYEAPPPASSWRSSRES